jgi:two-component system sensor histidine kinase MprB
MSAWLQRKSFRVRLSALVAGAVGVAIALAALASYLLVRHQLYGQVDSSLQNELSATPPLAQGGFFNAARVAPFLGRFNNSILQVVYANGEVEFSSTLGPPLPVNRADASLALANGATTNLRTIRSGGSRYRVITLGGNLADSSNGVPVALQIARPLTDIEHTLADLRLILWIVALTGIGVAVVLGYLIGKATIRPVERLTAAAEHVTATQDLESTIDDRGEDELARLARSFNAMLAALAASRQQQAQLISDAGHELRTPLTSLRTNIEVLLRVKDLPPSDRADLLKDVNAQLEEMTTLVGDLVELAREDEAQAEPMEVRLDAIVQRAIERARRRAPHITFDIELTPGSVRAQPLLLERAVLNILDNAVKWSPPGGTVTVRLLRDETWSLDVFDEGPGIAPADLPHIFERFYRAEAARSLPGSGLGLAIVQQVVVAHGGTVKITTPPTGGTQVHIELPIVAEHEPGLESAGHPRASADAEPRPQSSTESAGRPGAAADAQPILPTSQSSLATAPAVASEFAPGLTGGTNPYGDPANPWDPEKPPANGSARFPWSARPN